MPFACNPKTGENVRHISTNDEAYFSHPDMASRGWQVHVRQKAAIEAMGPPFYVVAGSRTEMAGPYYTETNKAKYVKAGYTIFETAEGANAWLHPITYWHTGAHHTICTRRLDAEGVALYQRREWKGPFNSREEAIASLPPLPVLFSLRHGEGRYTREENESQQDGEYGNLVKAIRALTYRNSTFVTRSRDELNAWATINEVWGRFHDLHMSRKQKPIFNWFNQDGEPCEPNIEGSYRSLRGYENPLNDQDHVTYTKLLRFEFVSRLNRIARYNIINVCPECSNALLIGPDSTPGSIAVPRCAVCQRNYRQCAECHQWVHRTNVQQHENGSTYCVGHMPPPGVTGQLSSYQTDITETFRKTFLLGRGETKKTLWIGFEIECYPKQTKYDDRTGNVITKGVSLKHAITKVQERIGDHVICKRDGSVADGLEIVSIPASLNWHRENIVPALGDLQQYLSAWPHPQCGMHVHIGREELSGTMQGKMLSFMHAKHNQAFIDKVAGRANNHYTQRGQYEKKIINYLTEAEVGTRYQALNFATRNRATLEFRIFRSNVAKLGFMKNLEFCHALAMWAKEESVLTFGRPDSYTTFLAWLDRTQRGVYPCLVKWCEEHALIEVRHNIQRGIDHGSPFAKMAANAV